MKLVFFANIREKIKNLTLNNYIFFIVLTLLLLASTGSIIGNLATNYPPVANIKWLFAILLCLVGYYLLHKNVFLEPYKVLLLSAILGLVIFPAWFYGGGDNSITLLYLMLVGLIAFLMLERFALKCIFNAISIGGAVVLLTITYKYPHLVQTTGAGQNVLADSLLQIIIIFSIACVSIAIYTNQYRLQHQQLMAVNAQLENLAITDGLSGVFNKRKITEMLAEICAEKEAEGVYVVMLDVDTFKNINDTLGHLAGDAAIRHVANHLVQTVGIRGCVGRYGGDEFLLVLYNMREAEMRGFADDLVKVPEFGTLTLTISGGVARREGAESCGQLIAKADELLLQAKKNGKNNICLWANAVQ